jgi:cytoskeletal protein CcmA (bactofilin family)
VFKQRNQGEGMKKQAASDHISTLLGIGTTVEGTLAFKDTIRLDGNVNGKILSESGTLIIGEKAVVNATIHVGAAIIKGTVDGQVQARERIDIHAPAKITGDIQAPVISIETGVQFNGQCSMAKPDTLPSKPQPKPPTPKADNAG